MVMPTDSDRELWRKATERPEEITAEERLTILQRVDPATQVANALQVSDMTPEQLEEKARTQPNTLKEAECRLLTYGYHTWSPSEYLDNSSIDWALEDKLAHQAAIGALKTPEDYALAKAVSARSDFFFQERSNARKVTMAKVAQNLGNPCTWVSRLIDPSKGIMGQTQRWGFVVLKGASLECSEEVWESFFLKRLNEFAYERGLFWLTGGSTINQTKQLIVREGFVHESDREDLQSAFNETLPSGNASNPHILSNTFLLVDSEVMASFANGNPPNPWIWAYETNFTPSAALPTETGVEKYAGKIKVALDSLFTWFYAARKEEIYSMDLFWEKAQRQPHQALSILTSMGRYHGPLVLLEKGSSYPFNTYQLQNEA